MKILDYLQDLRRQELISSIEVEFARFLIEINPKISDEVILASAACVQAQRNGNVCLDLMKWDEEWLFGDQKSNIRITESLKKEWLQALKNSGMVSRGDELQPLVLEETRLYLHRFWHYEQELSEWLNAKAKISHKLTSDAKKIIQSLFPPSDDLFKINWQKVAVQLSFLKDLVVISGGPGTGKTFTVLNILAAQALSHPGGDFRIALGAPTGKAARRLSESIEAGIEKLPDYIRQEISISSSAQTVHKLLGSDFRGSTFKFNKDLPLPYDLIVIDEASMLDITMWVRLIRAIGSDSKLIVLGDKDQLASVEAGSILEDICGGDNSFSKEVSESLREVQGLDMRSSDQKSPINDSIVFLRKSYRFGEESGIQKFAEAVNASDADLAIEILKNKKYTDLQWQSPTSENMDAVINNYAVNHHFYYLEEAEEERLKASNKKRILCALRKGPFGVEQINERAERRIKRRLNLLTSKTWFDGRIIMATRNDALLKVRNGDIGVYLDSDAGIIEFEGQDKKQISASRMKEYEPAYAITIHKSQGSEFDEVAIVLPNQMNSVISKEIIYTAVTRARQNTLIIANEDILRKAIQRSVSRNSGLRQKIWGN